MGLYNFVRGFKGAYCRGIGGGGAINGLKSVSEHFACFKLEGANLRTDRKYVCCSQARGALMTGCIFFVVVFRWMNL